MASTTSPPTAPPSSPPGAPVRGLAPCIPALVMAAAGVWAVWGSLREMSHKWAEDPTYQHGYLVPLMVPLLLWFRRDQFPAADLGRRRAWAGLALALLGAAMQLAGAYFYVRWLAGVALIPYLGAAVLMAGGWPMLRWAAPALAFLVFMVPLPYRYEAMMKEPLKLAATLASTCTLQTLGLPALREGNIIVLDGAELGVEDACSGLKMLIVFGAMAMAVALLARRRLLERVLILASAVPIAILSNVARITLTALAVGIVGERALHVSHDLAGWLMMPMGLAMLGIELWFFDRLFIDEAPADPLPAPRVGRDTRPLGAAG